MEVFRILFHLRYKARNRVFGVALTQLPKDHGMPPVIITDIIQFLSKEECLKSEGILRVSGWCESGALLIAW